MVSFFALFLFLLTSRCGYELNQLCDRKGHKTQNICLLRHTHEAVLCQTLFVIFVSYASFFVFLYSANHFQLHFFAWKFWTSCKFSSHANRQSQQFWNEAAINCMALEMIFELYTTTRLQQIQFVIWRINQFPLQFKKKIQTKNSFTNIWLTEIQIHAKTSIFLRLDAIFYK